MTLRVLYKGEAVLVLKIYQKIGTAWKTLFYLSILAVTLKL